MITGPTPIVCFRCDQALSQDQALKVITMAGLIPVMPEGVVEPVVCIDCVLSASLDDWRFDVSAGLLRHLRDGGV